VEQVGGDGAGDGAVMDVGEVCWDIIPMHFPNATLGTYEDINPSYNCAVGIDISTYSHQVKYLKYTS